MTLSAAIIVTKNVKFKNSILNEDSTAPLYIMYNIQL